MSEELTRETNIVRYCDGDDETHCEHRPLSKLPYGACVVLASNFDANDQALRDRLAQAELQRDELANALVNALQSVTGIVHVRAETPEAFVAVLVNQVKSQLATAQRDREEAIAHAVGMSQEITHLGEQLATARARIERLEEAVRAMRASRLAYWRGAADAAGDPADDATVLRDAAKYDALFQLCERALADEPGAGIPMPEEGA